MSNKNLLYDLLEKEYLSAEETFRMNEMLENDNELKSFVVLYNNLKNVVNTDSHLDLELLGEYILFQSTADDENKIIKKYQNRIEDHLRKCKICKANYRMLNEELSETELFVSQRISAERKIEPQIQPGIFQSMFQNKSFTKYASVFAVLLIFYTGTVFVTNYFSPSYHKEITEISDNLSLNSRGRSSQEFLKGIAELDKGNFDEAVEALTEDLERNYDSKTIFYTHFILGQAYLKNTQKAFAGINLGINEYFVNQSIAEFQKCIDNNKGAQFASINYDAHYFMGRAFLMQNDFDSAIKQFNVVVENKGKYLKQAKEFIRIIEEE